MELYNQDTLNVFLKTIEFVFFFALSATFAVIIFRARVTFA